MSRPLQAGPCTVVLDDDGSIGPLLLGDPNVLGGTHLPGGPHLLGGTEIVRRIGVVVRDADWGTIAPEVQLLDVQQGADGFCVTIRATHRRDDIDYTWDGTIDGSPDGTVRYSMRGRAAQHFRTNRIGFVVLQPLALTVGRPVTVEHSDGSVEHGEYPQLIAPHQPFLDVRSLAFVGPADSSAPAVSTVSMRFEGETFEMEDQRNWSDASFKLYGRPLALPFPFDVEASERFEQSVTVSVSGAADRIDAHAAGTAAGVSPVVVEVNDGSPAVDLHIGVGLGPGAPGRDLAEAGLVGASAAGRFGVSHLRLDIDLERDAAAVATDVGRAVQTAHAMDAGLELAVRMPDPTPGSTLALGTTLDELARLITPVRELVTSVLVLSHRRASTTSEADLARVVSHLRPLMPDARIGAGTDAYLAELNRNPLLDSSADFCAFSLNPQVHDTTDLSIVQTAQSLPAMVETARARCADLPVHVTPVTVLPRFNPNATTGAVDAPRTSDARLSSRLIAAWCVALIAALVESRADSTTLLDLVGPEGLFDSDESGFRAAAAAHVILDAQGGVFLPVACASPGRVAAFAVRTPTTTRLVLANLAAEATAVQIEGLGGTAKIRSLDAESETRASRNWQHFRTEQRPVETVGGVLDVNLSEYAIVSVEW